MKRFGKVALLLAAVFVMTCGAAYAAVPVLVEIPGDQDSALEAFVLSGDPTWPNYSPDLPILGRGILSPDKTSKPAEHFLTYNVTLSSDVDGFASLDLVVSDSKGLAGRGQFGKPGSGDFDRLLVRVTGKKTNEKAFDLNFRMFSADIGAVWSKDLGVADDEYLFFGLRNESSDAFADNCTINCGTFKYNIDNCEKDPKFQSKDLFLYPLASLDVGVKPTHKTIPVDVTWTGAGDKEYYVQCCDHLGFVVASQAAGKTEVLLSSDARNVVVANLNSADPFVRVRVADTDGVAPLAPFFVGLPFSSADIVSRDFRNWAMGDYFDDVVDVPREELYNLGVQYTENCLFFDSSCNEDCWSDQTPFIAVTNLGGEEVCILDNYEDTNGDWDREDWICQSWTGLCQIDDMMSGDFGLLDGPSSRATRNWDSTLYDPICHIFPAFSHTFRAGGNIDIEFDAFAECGEDPRVAAVRGRLNTGWTRGRVSTSTFCESCREDLFVYWTCDDCADNEYRRDIFGLNAGDALIFAESDDLSVTRDGGYNNKAGEGEYAAIEAEIEVRKNVDPAPNFLLTKLAWTVKGTDLEEAGLVDGDEWWRKAIWEKMQITVGDIRLDDVKVESHGGAGALTSAELAFLTTVKGPQGDLTNKTSIDVDLFLFVFDGVAPGDPDGKASVKYYKNEVSGNRYLVLFDGDEDGFFNYRAVISKKVTTPVDVFAVSPATLSLNLAIEADNTKTLTAVNAPLGATINWEVASGDEAFVVVSPDTGATVEVTGLAVGTATVRATVEGTAGTATCAVTVVDEPTPPVPGDSSGGCSMGFAPAALLLLAPLFFLKR